MDEEQKEPSVREQVVQTLHDIAVCLAVICILFLLIFRIVIVSGTSMNHTLLDGDYLLLVSSLFYREPQQGDIIVASKQSFEDGKPIVKRVIATEGQTVDIDFDNSIVYVDGVALEEDYVWSPTVNSGGVSFPLTVSDGCVFVMGDNRSNSRDSRFLEIGLIDTRQIIGKAIFLFLPGTNGTNAYGEANEERDFSRIGVID